ncbi:aldehyde dehydrogenase family protein, partial [Actinosynnema sp.]|uniref:aldehyde dehydrogenase family protein n=1 Tax=Actinosynnema sp. TaxID=1872144 RepID=UPI003F86A618
MPVLRSYVSGRWHTPTTEGAPLHDAVTGEEIARISSDGVDMGAALRHGREVGGPALRELTFHQRGALLKALASHLREHRDELYELSARTGATRTDSVVDVDGGIGVLFTYSSKARRELPAGTVVLDGPVETLSKDGSFLGRHVYTRLPGVAVQINAFNVPVWGSLEKFAPAFLAGVPTLVKPATPTGYVAEAFVRILVESGLLPAGSLQLVSGSVPDLFDHLRLG